MGTFKGPQELIGRVFDRLRIVKFSGKFSKGGGSIWMCLCECGRTIEVDKHYLLSHPNGTKSCGCAPKKGRILTAFGESLTASQWGIKTGIKRKEIHRRIRSGWTVEDAVSVKLPSHRHGMDGTSTYNTWRSMLSRCRCKTNHAFKSYGGRGIGVCEEWVEFEAFLKDMGTRPSGLTLERRDNNKGYCKDNCYWATRTEQSRNTRGNVLITAFGQTKCIVEWHEDFGIPQLAIARRIRRGVPPEIAVTAPTNPPLKVF